MRLALIALMLMVTPVMANDDLMLQGKRTLVLDRPLIVNVVKPEALLGKYAEANFAYAKAPDKAHRSWCIISISEDRLQYLYHEIQHCVGVTHNADGTDQTVSAETTKPARKSWQQRSGE